jgi:hypothetical protein
MRFQKIPYHLRYSIDEIIADARKHITVHYLHNIVHAAGKTASKGGTGCQIIDPNDYGKYFYEAKKFEILTERIIRCLDQRSAHQNAIIAFKKWEFEVREFLTNPPRASNEIIEETRTIAVGHPTSPDQMRAVLKNSSQSQKTPRAKARQSGVMRSHQG